MWATLWKTILNIPDRVASTYEQQPKLVVKKLMVSSVAANTLEAIVSCIRRRCSELKQIDLKSLFWPPNQ